MFYNLSNDYRKKERGSEIDGDQRPSCTLISKMHESVSRSLNMHDLKTINVIGMIKISWGAIQLPPWFREQLYSKPCMERSAESLSKPRHFSPMVS